MSSVCFIYEIFCFVVPVFVQLRNCLLLPPLLRSACRVNSTHVPMNEKVKINIKMCRTNEVEYMS